MTKTLSSSSRRSVPIMRSQIAFARGAPGGLVRIRMPICGEYRVECLGEPAVSVLEQERYACGAVGDVHQQIPGGLGGPRSGWMRGHSCQMCPAGTVLDRDQGVDSSEHHGSYVHEIHGQDSLRLGGEELAPGWACPARCGIDTSVVQDLPNGGGGDAMAEPDQFTLHPPMSPGGILGFHANHQSFDRCCGRRDARVGDAPSSPISARPTCGAKPGLWQERPGRPRPSGDLAQAETERPAMPGRRACSEPRESCRRNTVFSCRKTSSSASLLRSRRTSMRLGWVAPCPYRPIGWSAIHGVSTTLQLDSSSEVRRSGNYKCEHT